MTIKGLGNGAIPPSDPRRAEGAAGGKAAQATSLDAGRATARPAPVAGDVLELSPGALSGRTVGGVPPRDTLTPARVQEISARIASGHYDRPEVLDVVLDRLAPHLDTLGESAG